MNVPSFEIGKTTIGQLIDVVADEFGDRNSVMYDEKKIYHTYRELKEICDTIAKGLMALGVKKGEKIAIWANNIPEWIYTQFATGKIGAVLVTVNTSYRAFELEYLLKQSDTSTLILIDGVHKNKEYLDIIHTICPEIDASLPGRLNSQKLPLLKNIILIGDSRNKGMFSWNDVLERSEDVSDEELRARQNSSQADDVINMQYTSGTTGFPKGVMLTHTNIIGNAKSISECMHFSSADNLCIPVPFFHCFGCVLGILACVVSGAAMSPVIQFKPDVVLEVIEHNKCTAVHGVPTMFIAELEEMEKKTYRTESLRTGIMAGSPCPIEVMKKVVHKMGASQMTIAYGQTESSPVISQTRPEDSLELRVSTVGRALPGVEVKIVAPGTDEVLPYGIQGELMTRGYLVMKGYYKMAEATRDAIDRDGWLHTGDLAVMDENGYIKITGRIKDMIIRGGENIYPREIEEFLYRMPKIKDVQVVGVPSRKYGEEVVAFIQVKDGENLSDEELKKFCLAKIAHYKIPAFFITVKEYPTTASGKIQKYKLREYAIKFLNREKDSIINMG